MTPSGRLAVLVACSVGAVVASGAAAEATTTEVGRAAQVDVNRDVTNPCTGALGDVVDAERDSWTAVERSDGSWLLRGHSTARVAFTPYDEDAASYAGEEEFSDVETLSRGDAAVLLTHRLRLRGTDGATLALTESVRVVVDPQGVPRTDRESFALECGQAG